MRERGLLKLGRLGASRWSAAKIFWVGTFSTGTMGNFQPELTYCSVRSILGRSAQKREPIVLVTFYELTFLQCARRQNRLF